VLQRHFDLVGSVRRMTAFNTALNDLCAPMVPGLSLDTRRENAAYHYERKPSIWRTKANIDDIAGAGFVRTIQDDNSEDVQLIHFIDVVNNGLFVNEQKAGKQRVVPMQQTCMC
jgi:hypothetical protein